MNPHMECMRREAGQRWQMEGTGEVGGDGGGVGRDHAELSPSGAGPEAGVG